jgi:energy-coupling factor transport system substrate-specific component
MSVKDIVIIGMLTAVLVTVQVSLSFLPNIELVSLLIIIYTLVFRWRALFIVYAFIFVEGLLFGFGQWWFSWLYIWPLLFFIAMLFNKVRSVIFWAMMSCMFGLMFGALSAVPVIAISGLQAGIAYWVQGIIFDVTHGIGNFVTALLLYYPLYLLLGKIHKQFYG